MFSSIQASRLASAIGNSVPLTALLSGIHLVGLTLLVGSVLVSSLSLLGFAFRNRPPREVARDSGRSIVIGLVLSVASGLLLVLPRIVLASQNGVFQAKMVLLCASIVFYFLAYRNAIGAPRRTVPTSPLVGAVGFALWFGVAVAGCAFILLE